MRIETARKITDLGKAGQRTLVYYILKEKGSYGVGISIEESGEESVVRDVTVSEERALRLSDLLATNYVTPVSLRDVVYDWLS